ncbi:uncharacterized protein LOC142557932 [Dermacentor variabilis]|uniref:uncharacterized protein LOC142557932 n=1 Tax=Dermacentor variabilis TaxID=34621 RepID=UPI003F5B4862
MKEQGSVPLVQGSAEDCCPVSSPDQSTLDVQVVRGEHPHPLFRTRVFYSGYLIVLLTGPSYVEKGWLISAPLACVTVLCGVSARLIIRILILALVPAASDARAPREPLRFLWAASPRQLSTTTDSPAAPPLPCLNCPRIHVPSSTTTEDQSIKEHHQRAALCWLGRCATIHSSTLFAFAAQVICCTDAQPPPSQWQRRRRESCIDGYGIQGRARKLRRQRLRCVPGYRV